MCIEIATGFILYTQIPSFKGYSEAYKREETLFLLFVDNQTDKFLLVPENAKSFKFHLPQSSNVIGQIAKMNKLL